MTSGGRQVAEGRSSFSTWLLSIARFKALSARRRRTEAEWDEKIETTVADPSNDPEAVLQENERSELLRQALTRLSLEHREIIDLVYYHEKSVDECAQILGIPAATVKAACSTRKAASWSTRLGDMPRCSRRGEEITAPDGTGGDRGGASGPCRSGVTRWIDRRRSLLPAPITATLLQLPAATNSSSLLFPAALSVLPVVSSFGRSVGGLF